MTEGNYRARFSVSILCEDSLLSNNCVGLRLQPVLSFGASA